MKIVTTFSDAKFITPVPYTTARAGMVETSTPGILGVNVKHIFIALVFILLVGCSGCKSEGEGMLPRELQGAWVTDDPQYADRLIKFWPSEYVILTGIGTPASVQTIEKVDRQPYGSGFTLVIYTTNRSGAHDQMGVSYSPADGGELRFRNQKQVWKRVSEK